MELSLTSLVENKSGLVGCKLGFGGFKYFRFMGWKDS